MYIYIYVCIYINIYIYICMYNQVIEIKVFILTYSSLNIPSL